MSKHKELQIQVTIAEAVASHGETISYLIMCVESLKRIVEDQQLQIRALEAKL